MIAIKLRIFLVLISLLILVYIVWKIRRSKMDIANSIYWVVFSGLLLLLSIFPRIASFCSRLLGIEMPLNFLVLFFMGMIVLKQFLLTIELSSLTQKNKQLAQKMAIQSYDQKQVEKERKDA